MVFDQHFAIGRPNTLTILPRLLKWHWHIPSPDKVEAAYRRGDRLKDDLHLMAAWAEYCALSQKPAAVVPLRTAT